MRDCLAANPSKPQSCFWRTSLPTRNIVSSPTGDIHTGNLRPVQLAFKNLSKARLQKAAPQNPKMLPARFEPASWRASKRRSAASSRRRSAFGALVSFIEVPQSIEVPLCGTFHFSSFFVSSFRFPSENQHTSCTSGYGRSLPFEAPSPERASNDHVKPLPRGHHRYQ